jgi:hypothetical protein
MAIGKLTTIQLAGNRMLATRGFALCCDHIEINTVAID